MSVQDQDGIPAPHVPRERIGDWPRLFGRNEAGDDAYRPSMSPVTAAVVILACLALLWALIMSYAHSRQQAAAERAARFEESARRQAELVAEQAQREAAARAQQLQADQLAQESRRSQAIAERQRTEDEAAQAAASADQRKEQAWAAYYRKPAACNDATTMECANAYIRARRQFELQYAKSGR
jgi:hypothetical protein